MMVHRGREYGLVLSGRIGATVGFESYELGPGDSVVFEARSPHRFWTIGSGPTRVRWTVCSPPIRSGASPPRSGSSPGSRARSDT